METTTAPTKRILFPGTKSDNHAKRLVSIDFFTVPAIRFQVLYVFLVLADDRRRILHFNVAAHPTAEWSGQQLREAFPFAQLPRYVPSYATKMWRPPCSTAS